MKYVFSFLVLIFSNAIQSYPKIETLMDNNNYLLIHEASLPIIDVNISFDFGSKDDLANKGITSLSFELLHQQINNTNQKYINILEGIGAQYSSSVSRESSSISIRFINTRENINVVSSNLGKMLANRNISRESFELTKEAMLDNIKSRDLDPSTLLSYKSNEEYFKNSSLAHPINGYEKTVNKILVEDISSHLDNLLIQENTKISFVGDITKSQAIGFISKLQTNLPQKSNINRQIFWDGYQEKSKLIEIDHDSQQTHISIMIPSVTRTDEDFYNILVANYILGGSGFGSMLMTEIREKNGLAYSIYSYLLPYENFGIMKIGMQTENKNTRKALEILSDQLEIFQSFDIDKNKIETAKLGLIRSFELRFDTNKKMLNTLSAINKLNLHNNYFDNYIKGIKSVSKESIRKALKMKIGFNKKLIMTVGNN